MTYLVIHLESHLRILRDVGSLLAVAFYVDDLALVFRSLVRIVVGRLLRIHKNIDTAFCALYGRIYVIVVAEASYYDPVLFYRVLVIDILYRVELPVGVSFRVSLGRLCHRLATVMLRLPSLHVVTEGLSPQFGEIDVGQFRNPVRVAFKEGILRSLLEVVGGEVLLSAASEKPVPYVRALNLPLHAHKAAIEPVFKDMADIFCGIAHKNLEHARIGVGPYPPADIVYLVYLLKDIPYIRV